MARQWSCVIGLLSSLSLPIIICQGFLSNTGSAFLPPFQFCPRDHKGLSLSLHCGVVYTPPVSTGSPHVCQIHNADDNALVDIHSPRDWLEHCEAEHGQQGAYTVVRCDYNTATKNWKVWGESFHMKRLNDSYHALAINENGGIPGRGTTMNALNITNQVKDRLLESLAASLMLVDGMEATGIPSFTAMLTLLWTSDKRNKRSSSVQVQGHAFFPSKEERVQNTPTPEPLTVAIPYGSDEVINRIPNRCSNLPHAKLSSWCRRRRPIEEKFMPPGIREVLLIRTRDRDIELLEGLTSNLFVFHRDGTLLTQPTDSVLPGYARQLVLDFAKENGIPVVIGPIRLAEAHLWEEMFLTSSVKLMAPIQRLVMVSPSRSVQQSIAWTQDCSRANFRWRRIYQSLVSVPT